jgi:hypothetical protein
LRKAGSLGSAASRDVSRKLSAFLTGWVVGMGPPAAVLTRGKLRQ